MRNIENFRKSLKFVLKWEGGYVNDPADPGHATKWGITQGTYDAYRKRVGKNSLDVSACTSEEAVDIYSHDFWDRVGADALGYPLCTVVFDSSVNCGVGRALAWLKQSSDVLSYLQTRNQYYIDIAKKNPGLSKFLRGWLARTADLKKLIETAQADVDYDVTQLPDWHF